MRLIDATTLRAEFTGNFHEMWHYTGIWATIDVAPTIDAVPVVRCGECKFHKKSVMDKDGYVVCTTQRTHFRKDFFCANGKRRDEGAEQGKMGEGNC